MCCTLEIYIYDDEPFDQILKSVVHELRHAYQHDVCFGLIYHEETEETVEIWGKNLRPENYEKYYGDRESYLLNRYQPIEIDARWFADEY
jgi:hypothetical protein